MLPGGISTDGCNLLRRIRAKDPGGVDGWLGSKAGAEQIQQIPQLAVDNRRRRFFQESNSSSRGNRDNRDSSSWQQPSSWDQERLSQLASPCQMHPLGPNKPFRSQAKDMSGLGIGESVPAMRRTRAGVTRAGVAAEAWPVNRSAVQSLPCAMCPFASQSWGHAPGSKASEWDGVNTWAWNLAQFEGRFFIGPGDAPGTFPVRPSNQALHMRSSPEAS